MLYWQGATSSLETRKWCVAFERTEHCTALPSTEISCCASGEQEATGRERSGHCTTWWQGTSSHWTLPTLRGGDGAILGTWGLRAREEHRTRRQTACLLFNPKEQSKQPAGWAKHLLILQHVTHDGTKPAP